MPMWNPWRGYKMKAGLVYLGFSTFANAERTLLRMAGSISFKQRTCLATVGEVGNEDYGLVK